MYKVYGTVKSRAARVIWMLEELGVPFEHVNAGPRSAEVLAVNPTGKVPVLEVEGQAIADSTAILQFLADRHGRLTHPAGTIPRALQDSLTHFLLDELDAVLWTAARHSFILPEDMRLPAIKESLKWEYARSLSRLAERLGSGPFLMGETMTVPDILATHCLIWGAGARFPTVEGSLSDYLDRMRARPAFQRAMAR
ncbi:MAG: glutathione S-transferase family protein [Aquincola tertiaricarbonis]